MKPSFCLLCGSDNHDIVFEIPDLLLERSDSLYLLIKCCNCGLVYQLPKPTLSYTSDHYPDEYDSYQSGVIDNVKFPQKRSSFIDRIKSYGALKRKRLVNKYVKHGRLLDIGCASGQFLASFNQDVWEIFGVEVNSRAADSASRNLGVNIFCGTLEQASYPSNFFHVITMWDVIEHLNDPVDTLKEISRILRPGGYLILRTPNINSVDARIFGRNWAGLDAPRHLFVFSLSTLGLLLEKGGLNILKSGPFIGTYSLFVLSVRFVLRNNGLCNVKNFWLIKLLSSRVCQLLLSPLFKLYGIIGKAPLITIIATKSAINQAIEENAQEDS